MTEFPPHPCRTACWLPITGRLKHLGAHPAQLYTCHCPAVCRAVHMATSPAERADRQLHPTGNVYFIIRKDCIRTSYNKSTIKPLPWGQPLSHVQGYFVYWFVCRRWFWLFFSVSVPSLALCEPKCQNAIAVLAMFILSQQNDYTENSISEFALVNLILLQPR